MTAVSVEYKIIALKSGMMGAISMFHSLVGYAPKFNHGWNERVVLGTP